MLNGLMETLMLDGISIRKGQYVSVDQEGILHVTHIHPTGLLSAEARLIGIAKEDMKFYSSTPADEEYLRSKLDITRDGALDVEYNEVQPVHLKVNRLDFKKDEDTGRDQIYVNGRKQIDIEE